jgi:mannose-6-phosphate isomerase-like protein (cupin superfamily)
MPELFSISPPKLQPKPLMMIARRKFVEESLKFTVFPSFLGAMATTACQQKDVLNASGFIVSPQNDVWYIGGRRKSKVTILISKHSQPSAGISILAEIIPPGESIPLHRHGKEDEMIFISAGRGIITIDEEERELHPGALAFVQKSTWHGLRNDAQDYLHLLVAYNPAGFEDYFRNIGVKNAGESLAIEKQQWDDLAASFSVEYK